MLKVVIRKVFQLKLVGQAVQSVCIARGYYGVRKLPYLAYRVLERAVAVYHGLYLNACALEHEILYSLGHRLRVFGEQLYVVVSRPVGAEQPVFRIVARTVHG